MCPQQSRWSAASQVSRSLGSSGRLWLHRDLDGIEDRSKRLELALRGVFAGNIFDLGAQGTADMFESGEVPAARMSNAAEDEACTWLTRSGPVSCLLSGPFRHAQFAAKQPLCQASNCCLLGGVSECFHADSAAAWQGAHFLSQLSSVISMFVLPWPHQDEKCSDI